MADLTARSNNDYTLYWSDRVLIRATERYMEIIGEVVKNLTQLHPNIAISGARRIIGLRNIIAHSYDSVEPEIIWGIVQKDIPLLREEVKELLINGIN